MHKKGLTVPDYIVEAVMQPNEATVIVQFKRAYDMQVNNQIRHFTATNQVRLPYSIVYDLIRLHDTPIFILNQAEAKLFFKHYGIQES